MKRKVKIAFVDYWGSFYAEEMDNCLVMRILRKHYDVELCSKAEDAEYVFFSVCGDSHWGVPDSCVKIFQTGENLSPDFNACDYAIGFEWMEFGDRYTRFPCYMFYDRDLLNRMEHKHEIPDDWDLKKEKPSFCSFVVSNHRNPKRNECFRQLSGYRKVDSGGRYLNNIGGPVSDKFDFESKHKFSICFENGAHSGYTTEKLVQALAARTVPIYWGDPDVGKVFNKKAFIDAYSYPTIDDVIKRIEQIDKDDDLYLSIIREPAMRDDVPGIDEALDVFEKWLIHIFEQPIEKAYRRNREMHGRWYVEKRFRLDKKGNAKAIRSLRKQKVSKIVNHLKRKFLK